MDVGVKCLEAFLLYESYIKQTRVSHLISNKLEYLECSEIVPFGSFWAHYCDWVHSDEPLHIDAQRCS